MKKYLLLVVIIFVYSACFSAGVAILNWESGIGMPLEADEYDITIDNQVAVVTNTSTFTNLPSFADRLTFACPLPVGASATSLKYYIAGQWHQANFSAIPDSGGSGPGPGDDVHQALAAYLGENPLYFEIIEDLNSYEVIKIELTFVQLLTCEFSITELKIQALEADLLFGENVDFSIDLEIISERTIEDIDDYNFILDTTIDNAYHYTTSYSNTFAFGEIPQSVSTIYVKYEVSNEEFGAFGFSTVIPPAEVPDEYGNGYFTYVIEPNPTADIQIMSKAFTLVIDKSGSMSGTKITQAKEAATYIVNNLNENDLFNLVSFSYSSTQFRSTLVQATPSNIASALTFINNINANGATNISDAFETTVEIYDNTPATVEFVNLIIFLTDGQPTVGVTDDDQLVTYISGLANQSDEDYYIFPIGIGYDNVSRRLLSMIATENSGACMFVNDNELEVDLTTFYNTIRNPVVIDPVIAFSTNAGVTEVYPEVLPNLYMGNQLLISGRYTNANSASMTLTGSAYSEEVSYEYPLELVSEPNADYAFLTKVWAKQKIEHLLVEFYNNEGTYIGDAIENQIIEISLDYGVISPFTQFTGGEVPNADDELEGADDSVSSAPIQIIGNYPNPFNPETTISFHVSQTLKKNVQIKIFNLKGQLVKILAVHVNGKGNYSVVWHGTDSNDEQCASGVYFYTVDWGEGCVTSKMILVK